MKKYTANKWYGHKGMYNGRGPHPSPMFFLKKSVGLEEYKWLSKGPDCYNIRAAAVFDSSVIQWSHLLDTPWSMNAVFSRDVGPYHYKWRMIVVSVEDRETWIQRAIDSGACAWWLGSNTNSVWQWSEPEFDDNGIEIRPNGTTIYESTRELLRHQTKDYSLSDVLTDAQNGIMTYQEIGEKHGISRITVMKLANRAGIRRAIKKNG